jgi:hypothetical protein
VQVHDDFDARLAAAVGPLVANPITDEAVRAGATLERQPSMSFAPVVAVAAVVALGAAAVAVPRLAGPAAVVQSPAAPSVIVDALANVPHVLTPDGNVSVERAGASIRLVLLRDSGERIVLATKVEAVPSQDSSFISVTDVLCPAPTGLKQQAYAFGQANNVASSGFVFEGISAVGSFRGNLYLVAITSDPTATTWRAWIDEKGGTGVGGGPESFGRLPLTGILSDAGCFVDQN